MKHKILSALFALFIIGIWFGCGRSSKEEPEEPEIQEETFGNFEALPEWLQKEITAEKNSKNPDGYFRAEKGDWENQTFYNINIPTNSAVYDFRDENGEKVDMNIFLNFFETRENWICVYEWAKGYYYPMFGKGHSSMSGPRTKSLQVSYRRVINDKYESKNPLW